MVQKFLETLRTDPKARELIKAMPVPKNDQEAADGYAGLAKELGFDLTVDEIMEGLKSLEQKQKAQSDKVTLDADELDRVAGGKDGCSDTHVPGEWCWFTDSCSYVILYYDRAPVTFTREGNNEETKQFTEAGCVHIGTSNPQDDFD